MSVFSIYKNVDELHEDLHIIKDYYQINMDYSSLPLEIDKLFDNCHRCASGYSFTHYAMRHDLIKPPFNFQIDVKSNKSIFQDYFYYDLGFRKILKNHCIISALYSLYNLQLANKSLSLMDLVSNIKNTGVHNLFSHNKLASSKANSSFFKATEYQGTLLDSERKAYYTAYNSLATPTTRAYQLQLFNLTSGTKYKNISLFNNTFSYCLLNNQLRHQNEKPTFNIDEFITAINREMEEYRHNTLYVALGNPDRSIGTSLYTKHTEFCREKAYLFIQNIQRLGNSFIIDEADKIDALLFNYKRERSFHLNLFSFCYTERTEDLVKIDGQKYRHKFNLCDEYIDRFAALPNAFSRLFIVDFIGDIAVQERRNALDFLIHITFPVFEHLFTSSLFYCCGCSLEKSIQLLSSYVEEHYSELTYHFLYLEDLETPNTVEQPYMSAGEKERLANKLPKIFSTDFLCENKFDTRKIDSDNFPFAPHSIDKQFEIATYHLNNLPYYI